MPIYNLPPAIVCNVSHVHLKAEAITDEAFAQISLLPLSKQEDLSVETEYYRPAPQDFDVSSFRKKLTQSDTRTHGGFTVPKRSAQECLPHLDMSQDPPVQELVAKDLHGCKWRFRHVYRGKPKRHLLTSGWSTFVSSKKLVAGDICIFLREETGEVRVGVQRADVQKNAPTSVISVSSMQHGVLTYAFYAICSGTIFTVVYRPWTTHNEFIIPFEKYVNAAETDYSIGTRVRMQVEGEEGVEHNFLNRVMVDGIVVGHDDVDHIRWPNSEWKSLKVKWDTTPGVVTCPDRVSPWNIEPMGSRQKKNTFGLRRYKRLCSRETMEPPLSKPNSGGRCMVFGVDLSKDPLELPSQQFVISDEFYTPISQCSVSETTQVQEACRSTSSVFSELQCNNSGSFTNQSFTEVLKHGTDLQRSSINLMRLNSYEDLIYELDQKFNFDGSLIDGTSNWFVTYTDNVGNMIPIGDYPWQEFQQMMPKLIIHPKKDGTFGC